MCECGECVCVFAQVLRPEASLEYIPQALFGFVFCFVFLQRGVSGGLGFFVCLFFLLF